MNTILNSINSLEDKLQNLLTNYEFLKEENEVLLQKNAELQVLLKEKTQELNNYQKEYDYLKIAKTIDGSSSRETKLKINALIREIDKCIIQLSS